MLPKLMINQGESENSRTKQAASEYVDFIINQNSKKWRISLSINDQTTIQ
jgi:hypothetical protein